MSGHGAKARAILERELEIGQAERELERFEKYDRDLENDRKPPTTPPVKPPARRRGPYRRPRFDRMADELVIKRAVLAKAGNKHAVAMIDALITSLRRLATGEGPLVDRAAINKALKMLAALEEGP